MTSNERRILALMSHYGPLTKRALCRSGKMGWATVTKLVNRLESQQVILNVGTSNRDKHVGKNSYVYDLNHEKPLFVGVDVEYRRTTVGICNLRQRIVHERQYETPTNPTEDELVSFVTSCVRDAQNTYRQNDVSFYGGVGVGVPLRLIRDDDWTFSSLRLKLATVLPLPVSVENNIRAYTIQEARKIAASTFAVVSIRNGVGLGIMVDGNLYSGEDGFAGEIGHILEQPNGKRCRCGKIGCLETVVNEHELVSAYRQRLATSLREGIDTPERLFTDAYRNNDQAVAVLDEFAEPLGRALSILLLLLDIRCIYLVGNFGEYGQVWIPQLNSVISKHKHSHHTFDLTYRRLNENGYLLGAALLSATEYLDFTVLSSHQAQS